MSLHMRARSSMTGLHLAPRVYHCHAPNGEQQDVSLPAPSANIRDEDVHVQI